MEPNERLKWLGLVEETRDMLTAANALRVQAFVSGSPKLHELADAKLAELEQHVERFDRAMTSEVRP